MVQKVANNSVSVLGRKFTQMGSDIKAFFIQAIKTQGLDFFLIISATYFLQGFRNYVFSGAITWYMGEVLGLGPAQIQSATSTIRITWNIKFIYGLIFDNFPILGRHDHPYYILSALLGLASFIALGIENVAPTESAATGLFFSALMAMAMCDVIADAMVVKRARLAGSRDGAALQTWCWIMFYVGITIGTPVQGEVLGPNGDRARQLMLYVYTPLSAALVVLSLFIREQPSGRKIALLNIPIGIWKLIQGTVLNTKILLPMIWILLRGAIPPNIDAAWSYWLRNIEINVTQQAYIDAAGGIAGIIGLLIFGAFLSNAKFRRALFFTQLFVAAIGFLDIVLYKRWNTKINLPDIIFLAGSQSVQEIVSNLTNMPFLVMAAQMCPAEIEASFYAGLTSISNGGSNVSIKWGGWLLEYLKIDLGRDPVTGRRVFDLTNLETAMWIKFGLNFAPCLLVFLLPDSSLIDPHAEMAKEAEVYGQITAAERDELEAKAAEGDAEAKKRLDAIAEYEAKRDQPATAEEANKVVV
ncbi:hypothetical protein HDU96_008482 [Phlyctochytrium bullatum]|nr:hypothetical protein HDU96_008482 [Phlyctochytrium bullatum]